MVERDAVLAARDQSRVRLEDLLDGWQVGGVLVGKIVAERPGDDPLFRCGFLGSEKIGEQLAAFRPFPGQGFDDHRMCKGKAGWVKPQGYRCAVAAG